MVDVFWLITEMKKSVWGKECLKGDVSQAELFGRAACSGIRANACNDFVDCSISALPGRHSGKRAQQRQHFFSGASPPNPPLVNRWYAICELQQPAGSSGEGAAAAALLHQAAHPW